MIRIAHRGAKREFPENTLPAFLRALERGADAVELDVHRTKDGLVVVHHDPVLGVYAGPLGMAGCEITNVTAAELARVEIAPGIAIPSLADVLDLVGTRMTVFVEIKGAGIAADVAAVLRGRDTTCAIHSFDHAQIASLVSIAPEIPRGLLFATPFEDPAGQLARHEARDLWPHWQLVDLRMVAAVHEVGCQVITWTVNDADAVLGLEALGVDALCGDDVRLFDEVLAY
ncbi:MAG TPA: glycerophosphodiester phosphodiesterase [Gemmatimonadaceae bacterium]